MTLGIKSLHNVSYIILVFVSTCYASSMNEDVKHKIFERTARESALIGHVVKTVQAGSDLECLMQCTKHQLCLSYNYKNSGAGLPVCQLNDQTKETKPNDLIPKNGFYYYGPIKSPCLDTNPCKNNGTCKPELNHPSLTYRCLCDAGFEGLNCESFVTDPSSNFDFKFPRRDTRDYVKLQKMPTLKNITISLSVKLTLNGDHTYISYATTTRFNMIFIHQRKSKLYLWIDNSSKIFKDNSGKNVPVLTADGHWHHMVVTWESHNGKTQLYIDGILKHSETGLQTGKTIIGNGLFVLGNDQDRYDGGYVQPDALVGEISRVNVWDKVLSPETIASRLRRCGNEVGTAVAWRDFKTASKHGSVTLNNASNCT